MTETSRGALDQFARLIQPFDVDEFVQQYFEQRPLYVRRDAESYFADMLTGADIDNLFQTTGLARSVVRIIKSGQEVHPDQFSEREEEIAPNRLSNQRVLDLFSTGHTVIVNVGTHVFPKLDRYCNELERELRFRVQPNIYITPYTAQGFDTHYDDHDVFILQVMGSKKWRIYHAPVELPSKRQKHVKGTHAVNAPQMELTLSPGDTLYIPRGFMHDASTDGTTSAHITLGLHPTRRFDLMHELRYLAQDLPAFRRSIPLGLLRDRQAAAQDFKRLLVDLIEQLDVDELIERRYLFFLDHRRFDFRDRFTELSRLNLVNLNTVVRRRPTILYKVERDARSITIRFAGYKIPIQPFLESALEPILGDDAFAIRDIEGFLSDTARVELVSKLIRSGFLEVVEWNNT